MWLCVTIGPVLASLLGCLLQRNNSPQLFFFSSFNDQRVVFFKYLAELTATLSCAAFPQEVLISDGLAPCIGSVLIAAKNPFMEMLICFYTGSCLCIPWQRRWGDAELPTGTLQRSEGNCEGIRSVIIISSLLCVLVASRNALITHSVPHLSWAIIFTHWVCVRSCKCWSRCPSLPAGIKRLHFQGYFVAFN